MSNGKRPTAHCAAFLQRMATSTEPMGKRLHDALHAEIVILPIDGFPAQVHADLKNVLARMSGMPALSHEEAVKLARQAVHIMTATISGLYDDLPTEES